jgi:hypothetical protein
LNLDNRQLGLVLARARAINGLVMLVAPGLVARVIFGKDASGPVTRALLRLVGIRDVVLGVGAITTLKEHTMDAEWVGMGAVADAVDGVVALVTPGLILRSRLVALIGGAAAAQGIYVARALADDRKSADLASEVDS